MTHVLLQQSQQMLIRTTVLAAENDTIKHKPFAIVLEYLKILFGFLLRFTKSGNYDIMYLRTGIKTVPKIPNGTIS